MEFDLYFLAKLTDSERDNLPAGEDLAIYTFRQRGILELTHNYGTETQDGFSYHDGNQDPQGFGHICFSVPDLDAAVAWFDSHNVAFKNALKTVVWKISPLLKTLMVTGLRLSKLVWWVSSFKTLIKSLNHSIYKEYRQRSNGYMPTPEAESATSAATNDILTYQSITDTANNLLSSFVERIPYFVAALIVLIIFWLLSIVFKNRAQTTR